MLGSNQILNDSLVGIGEGKKEKLFKLNIININKLYTHKFNSLLKLLSNILKKLYLKY